MGGLGASASAGGLGAAAWGLGASAWGLGASAWAGAGGRALKCLWKEMSLLVPYFI